MKLLDIFDHQSFKYCSDTCVVRDSLLGILKSFSFSCSESSVKLAIGRIACVFVKKYKKHRCTKDKFRDHELSWLKSTDIRGLQGSHADVLQEERVEEVTIQQVGFN